MFTPISCSDCRNSIQARTSAAARVCLLAGMRTGASEKVRRGRELLLALLQLHSVSGTNEKKLSAKYCLCACLRSFRSLAPFMLMNFRPRGATECLRAAVENDCALRQQKTQPCMYLFCAIVRKISAVTDLFESASLSWKLNISF